MGRAARRECRHSCDELISFFGHGPTIFGAGAAPERATGAIGAAVGLGSHDVAIVIALFTIATFRFLSPLKDQVTPGDDIPSTETDTHPVGMPDEDFNSPAQPFGTLDNRDPAEAAPG